MRSISLLVWYLVLLSGCAGFHIQQEPENNYIVAARFGTISEEYNNNLVVIELQKDFPAELAGVKRGDIMVSIDGNIISSRKALIKYMDNKQPGEHVSLVVNRNGQRLTFDLELKMAKFRPTIVKTTHLLLDDKKVTLAIIVSDVRNSFPNVPSDWANSIRNNLQSENESDFLSAFAKEENFSIVDRSRLKQILDEFQFNQLGFVSDKLRVKIGEMTGATHILDMSFSRYQGQFSSYDDVWNARLIEIESGKVLAVDMTKSHN